MSTVLIVAALTVALVSVVAAVLYAGLGRRGGGRGRRSGRGGLKRRFGPEYERVLARHDGDSKAAERELAARVERHGGLRPRTLAGERREQYVAHWAGLQERFVDSPREAVTGADELMVRLAEERGYPAGERRDDQFDALSVHLPHEVDGYRVLRHMAGDEGRAASTEELREAIVGARALFERLILAHAEDGAVDRPRRVGRDRDLLRS
ncbi:MULTISPECIES: hypothetical protein [unclassified Streptomyces]|uniref:hypothetical protein n=1 Tax=unclassified Streptomyces TaxID=2593676 RepID=UPI00363E4F1C